jgi:methylenetetrahydrofolate dehydrogenase (NADP+)/methenyltetrahydrofolate cyclohydrolase
VGDVAFDEVVEVAGVVTPVPGGVGPVTTATVLHNAVALAEERAGLPPDFAVG